MRHFSTLIAAVVVGPVSWLLLAFGQDGSAQALATGAAVNTGDLVRPALCLAGAGLLLGFLATPRFSPFGVVLTGAGYTASYLVLLLDPVGLLGLFPRSLSVAGHTADPSTPLRTGTALLLGAVMVVVLVGVTGRRRWPSTAEPAQQPLAEPTLAALAPGEPAAPVPAEPAGLAPGEPAARDRAPALPGPDLADAVAEPESVTRFLSSPRRFGSKHSNSYESARNGADRWPYAHEFRGSGQ